MLHNLPDNLQTQTFVKKKVSAAVLKELFRVYGQDEVLTERLLLQPGDVLIVDNFRFSHGRAPYVDGDDGRVRQHVALFSEKVDRGVSLPEN